MRSVSNAGRVMGADVVGAVVAGSASAASLTYDELQSLSYLEVKEPGLRCNFCEPMFWAQAPVHQTGALGICLAKVPV